MIRIDREGPVTRVTLDRPERRNAFSWEMIVALGDAIAGLETDRDCRCVVITGAGDHFCAGRDLAASTRDGGLPGVLERDEAWTRIYRLLRRLAAPSVAVVRGYAVAGGFTLAMGCDFVLAERSAQFGAFEMRHGFPASVCTPILARLAGPRLGLEFAMLGEAIPAERLFAAGLINRLADGAEALATLEADFVGKLAALDPRAVKLTRDTFRAAETMPLDHALDMGRQLNQMLAALGRFQAAGGKAGEKGENKK